MAGLDPKHNSRALTDGPNRAAARAYLKGIGFDDEALSKPIVGVAHSWTETMPCNFNHRALAAKVKEGVRAAGGTPMEFNTIAISDGITMGTSGMKTSLVSREVVADSIELVARGHLFDGIVALAACDKTIPGAAMALAVLGLSPMGSAMVPAAYEEKNRVATEAGALIMDVIARGQRPRDIITRKGLENAIAAIATSGGSTNGVLHLLALAREAGGPPQIRDLAQIPAKTPL